jgi:hypothetical protein
MLTQTAAILASDVTRPGIFSTLPPWALGLAGVVLLLVSGLFFWINKRKLDDDSFIMEMAGLLCGIGGILALWQGIFGG